MLPKSIINEHISEANLRTFFVGYDLKQYRYDALIECLLNKLVEFVFGYHKGIQELYDREILVEAAKSLYKISQTVGGKEVRVFDEVKKIYVDNDSEITDTTTDKYLKRGEFGELILHLFLREFIGTDPLISKIFFKDSNGMTVHGFDAIHIGPSLLNPKAKSIYLGESKLYETGESGVKELVNDIESHFQRDFLNEEFTLVGRKRDSFLDPNGLDAQKLQEYREFLKEKDYWFDQLDKVQSGEIKMQTLFDSVTIPMLCTYTSPTLANNDDETNNNFAAELEAEVRSLRQVFDTQFAQLKSRLPAGSPISTSLNIVLMLFPVPKKKELIKKLHTKLYHQQNA